MCTEAFEQGSVLPAGLSFIAGGIIIRLGRRLQLREGGVQWDLEFG